MLCLSKVRCRFCKNFVAIWEYMNFKMLSLFKNSKVVRKFVETYKKYQITILEKLYSAAVVKKDFAKEKWLANCQKKVLKSMTVRTVKKVSLHICLEFSKIVKVIFHLRKSMVNNNKQMSSIQMRIWQVKILFLLRNTKVHTKEQVS